MPATIPEVSAGTARFILRSLAIASHERRYASILPRESAGLARQLLLAAGDSWFVRACASSVFRAACRGAEWGFHPGIILHYIFRKHCLEEWVRRACDPAQTGAGACRQIVVLGAGLDTVSISPTIARPRVRKSTRAIRSSLNSLPCSASMILAAAGGAIGWDTIRRCMRAGEAFSYCPIRWLNDSFLACRTSVFHFLGILAYEARQPYILFWDGCGVDHVGLRKAAAGH
jgi:hypothetical protein